MKFFWMLVVAFALLFVFGGLAEAGWRGGGGGGVTFQRNFGVSYSRSFGNVGAAYGAYQPQAFFAPVYAPPARAFVVRDYAPVLRAPSYAGCGGGAGVTFAPGYAGCGNAAASFGYGGALRQQNFGGYGAGASFQFQSFGGGYR